MNVCKIYNKTMNSLEKFELKYVEQDESKQRRENVKEVNIIIGAITIIFYVFLLIVFGFSVFIFDYFLLGTIKYIGRKTTFKCDKE